jgi:hypothetical protein
VLPFPEPKSEPLEENSTLQEAFDEAFEEHGETLQAAPIAIIAIDPSGAPHAFAGRLEREVHYSASMLKIVFLYAAFALREAGRQRLGELEFDAEEGRGQVQTEFGEAISENRVPQLENLAEQFLLPRWGDLFGIGSGGELIVSEQFMDHVEAAYLEKENKDAAACVHAVGLGYLTKAMAEAEFLDPSTTEEAETADGIWLGGDFGFGYPAQTIESVNDGATAQGTSVHQMARLMTLLLDHKLVSDEADGEMMSVLERAAQNNLIALGKAPEMNFRTVASKIGIGSLKAGGEVLSEALVVEENETSRFFVVVFQNVLDEGSSSVFPVAEIVKQTISNFP